MFRETRTEEMCICPVSPVTPEPRNGKCSPSPKTAPTPQGAETKLVRVSARRGDSLISAAVFLVPLGFSEDQVEAAATPIAEALGQHEFEITGSVDGLACDIHLVTESDDPRQKSADPIAAEIERCIRAAIEGATRKGQTR